MQVSEQRVYEEIGRLHMANVALAEVIKELTASANTPQQPEEPASLQEAQDAIKDALE